MQADNRPATSQIALQALEWAFLGAATILLASTESYQPLGNYGLALVLAGLGVRAWRTRRLAPVTGLGVPGIIFLVSAALAAWISYNTPASMLQLARIFCAAVLFTSLIESQALFKTLAAAGLTGVGALLAVYWPLQHDYAADPVKFALLNRAGLFLHRIFPSIDLSAVTGTSIHSNVAAGALAVILPISLGLLVQSWRQKRLGSSFLAGAASLLMLAGILLTGSRGAWLGLAGAGAILFLVVLQRRFFTQPNARLGFWLAVLLLGCAGLFAMNAAGLLEKLLGGLPTPFGTLQSRPVIWSQGLGLLRDYLFTGSGLMSFWLVHSSYALLIHTPFLAHSHNLFIEIGIEQGVLGLAAFVWIVLVFLRQASKVIRAARLDPFEMAGLAAVAVIVLHGMVDVVFYVERTLPLAGLVAGFAFSGSQPAAREAGAKRQLRWVLVACALLALAASALFYRQLSGMWFANLGAVAQTRLELSAYDPVQFDILSLDQIRQRSDLSKVEGYYQRALAADPNNLTARQRLTSLALSRAQYETAWELIQPAISSHQDDVTRMLAGDSLVAQGQLEQARRTIQGLSWGVDRLLFQAWYRYWLSQDYLRAASAWDTVLLLSPKNQNALYWSAKAHALIK